MTPPAGLRLSVAGVACGLLLVLPYGEAGHAPQMQLLSGLLLFAGTGVLCYGLFARRIVLRPVASSLAGFLVLLVVATASFLRAPAPYVSFLALLDLAMPGLAFWLGIEAGKAGEGVRRPLFLGFGLYALLYGWVVGAVALARGAPGSRLAAGFLDPNHLAAWLLLGAGALLADVPRGGGRLRVAGAAAIAFPLVLTRSLSGVLAGCALLVVWGFARFGRRTGGALLLLLLVVVLPLGLWVRARAGDTYAWDRWLIWKAAAPAALESPVLGIGPGMFAARQDAWNFPSPHGPFRTARRIGTPHSEPLGLAIELGALGVLAAAVALALLARDLRGKAAGWMLAVPAGVSALFSMTLHAPAVGITLALLVGLLVGSSVPVTVAATGTRRSIHAWALPATAGLFVLWTAILAPYLGWRALRHAARATDPVECVREAGRSRRWNPWDAMAYRIPAETMLRSPSLDPRLYYAASRLMEEALERNPVDAASWALMGRIEARAHIELFGDPGSRAAFHAAFARARELAPWNPFLLDEEARWSLRLGEEDEALALLEQALEREPLFIGALRLRVRIWEVRRGRTPAEAPGRAAVEESLARAASELAAAGRATKGIQPRSDYERTLLHPDAGEVPLGPGTVLESPSR